MNERRADLLGAAAIAAVLFAVYAAGACRTIYVGDSGELVAAVDVLGIPHPTGYPLYVLLGKLWTLLVPIGSVAHRMSLFSACFAALASGGLFLAARTLGLGRAGAVLAALLLAFAPSFWGEANVQRVYALNAFFVVATTLAAAAWHRERRLRSLLIAFFLAGLGASNHTAMVGFAAALGVFAVAVEPSVRSAATLARALACFALGLLPYAYLPIRSRFDPPLDWGNPETLGAFARAVTRADFWGRAWLEGPADLARIAADYLTSFAAELTLAGAALAVIGVVTAWPRDRFVSLPLLVMAANVGMLALHGSRSDLFIWHRYYLPSYAMAALLAGYGAERILARTPALAYALALAVPALLFVGGFREFDRSRYRLAEDFSRELLRGAPPGASLVASDDNILFVLLYLQLVEQVRPDVRLVQQGIGGAELPPLRFDPTKEAVLFTHHPNWRRPGVELVPIGLTFRVWPAGVPFEPPPLPKPLLEGEDDPRVPKDYLTRNLIGHHHYMLGVTLERRDWAAARSEFERAMMAAPENDVLFYNLGLIFERNGLREDALAAFRRSHAINDRAIASQSRARASDQVRRLETILREASGSSPAPPGRRDR